MTGRNVNDKMILGRGEKTKILSGVEDFKKQTDRLFGLTHLSAFGGAGNGGMDLVNSFLVWRLECESCHIEHI